MNLISKDYVPPHAALTYHKVLLIHQRPLVEPDVRFSRIRLSDKISHFRPRKAVGSLRQVNQSQMFMEVLVRVS